MRYLNKFTDFINESEFYKTGLHPAFWNGEEFNPEVRTKLLQIADDFYTDLKIEVPISDIQLTGSIANYTWTENSDLDIHVLLDFSQISEDTALVKKGLDGQRFVWNLRHPVVIRRHDVELYAQDINEPHIASGLYSILKAEWLVKPKWNPPTIDPRDVSRKAEAFATEIEEIEKMIKGSDSENARGLVDRVKVLKEKIMKARKDGLEKEGEFSIENLVFKRLRNAGWLERLIDAGSNSYSAIYSDQQTKMGSEDF